MILVGDVLDKLAEIPDESAHCCVTSPPYWGLRDYGMTGQIGLEATPEEYAAKMVRVFSEVRRVLRKDGTCWLNLGDTYGRQPQKGDNSGWGKHSSIPALPHYGRPLGGVKVKDLVGIPWRVAFALQADGWYLRSDIIWSKTSPMPESVTDRPTKSHEYLFLLSKSASYYYDRDAIAEPTVSDRPSGNGFLRPEQIKRGGLGQESRWEVTPTRNKRTVWEVAAQPYPEAHFATYPEKLVEPCILAGCPEGGTVLDPFAGSGTTLAVARKLGRRFIGIELNPEYVKLIEKRLIGIPESLFLKEVSP